LTYNGRRYTLSVMIRTFKSKETENVFQRTFSRKLPRDIQQLAFRKLRMLNRALTLADSRVPPGNRLEMLRGDREGQYSIRIDDRWRICFEWREGDAFDVEITDYH
jgi:proteic killer suppression protein